MPANAQIYYQCSGTVFQMKCSERMQKIKKKKQHELTPIRKQHKLTTVCNSKSGGFSKLKLKLYMKLLSNLEHSKQELL